MLRNDVDIDYFRTGSTYIMDTDKYTLKITPLSEVSSATEGEKINIWQRTFVSSTNQTFLI